MLRAEELRVPQPLYTSHLSSEPFWNSWMNTTRLRTLPLPTGKSNKPEKTTYFRPPQSLGVAFPEEKSTAILPELPAPLARINPPWEQPKLKIVFSAPASEPVQKVIFPTPITQQVQSEECVWHDNDLHPNSYPGYPDTEMPEYVLFEL